MMPAETGDIAAYDLGNLTIVRYPHPMLKKVCAPVERFEPALERLAARLLELMKGQNGVGLAAPQVGIPIRMFVCNVTGEEGDDCICINPSFVELSGAEVHEEGCLSLPQVNVSMRRAAHAVAEMQDVEGNRHRRSATNLLARVWQHENDHLDGRLIIDNMSTADEIANRRVLKQLRTDAAGAE